MLIGIVSEARRGETRVAATPATVVQLVKLGYDVVVHGSRRSKADMPGIGRAVFDKQTATK
ncbi:hypothetical protein ACFV8Z_47205 [Streptomyces sp. NPDC059837]|jgi:NAD(P) transhydrogenase subunit alpha|uniref:hypothetical protein n=1 Tax=unclassified Streptomyces TaxID=2593676 RepID=UPI003651355B